MNLQRIPIEEFVNALTHGVGALLSAMGLILLVALAWQHGTTLHMVSCGIFGVTLVLLYTASTLYHSARSPRLKHLFRVFDRSCIYLLIAGSYTPFTLVTLQGSWGWTLFGLIWVLAAAGVVFQILFAQRFKILTTVAYLLMGWLAVIAIKPLIDSLPAGGFAWLLAGGLVYSAGALFYLWKRLPYNHAIWHLFVLGGSTCHYLAVVLYVVPVAVG
ncbi:MAG TPA: hemolysin III family protein, partial [Syntrophales bacterium]|nr:hemolysin III family protein [Syntrophales bacterium]